MSDWGPPASRGASAGATATAARPAARTGASASQGTAVAPVLEVRDLKKHFPIKKGLLRHTVGHVYAVDGVSFSIAPGETLGLEDVDINA